MFRRSRIKIVAAIMSVLMLLFLGTLAVIYASSYYEVSEKNYGMLQRHAEMFVSPMQQEGKEQNQIPPDMKEPSPDIPMKDHGGKHFENTPAFKLSTFYSVVLSEDGSVVATDIADGKIYDKETLEKYASDILKKEKTRGTKGSLMYLVTKRNGCCMVAFMDNTVMQESMTTLFRYTLVFGSVALILLFFLAVYLAKRIVKPLEESYQKQKQFISDAGHELKTPVSVVNANAELLSREIGENKWLSNIQYENERMGKLVGQLLELARTESVIPEKKEVDFSRLIIGGALPFESVAFENGLAINTDIANDIRVNGNEDQLSQLVSILIDNAIRHSKNGKEITVKLSENKGYAFFCVENYGDPILQGEYDRLFERFYRADEVRNGESKHYGLGLAIAKAITEAHHGKIDVSCYDNKVCFSVRISKI